jgi:hypothetical protein
MSMLTITHATLIRYCLALLIGGISGYGADFTWVYRAAYVARLARLFVARKHTV